MKNIFKKLIQKIQAIYNTPEKKIIVIITSYNNSQWYEKNLKALLSQKYDNYYAIYIDDQSADKTGELVKKYLDEHPEGKRVILKKNAARKGALQNIYEAVHSLSDDTIVITYDGDDWFAHKNVLSTINKAYQNSNVWLTYGSYISTDGHAWCCEAISSYIVKNKLFRKHPWVFSHLRTFYAGLFKKIAKEDLMYEGKFFEMAWDLAFMFPMLEMAGNRFRFIKKVLYIYNCSNPINDFKKNIFLQKKLETTIRSKKHYPELNFTGLDNNIFL